MDAFRTAEKRYRFKSLGGRNKARKCSSEEEIRNILRDVLDFRKGPNDLVEELSSESSVFLAETRFYKFKPIEGFYIIKNAIDSREQLFWSGKCLREYSTYPYTNLTNLFGQSDTDLWKKACATNMFKDFGKLRWINIGIPYDWTNRVYKRSENPLEIFPIELDTMLSNYAAALRYNSYKSETSIINFYHPQSNMGAHVDEAEDAMDQPVISLSLGSACIFLLGGRTKEEEPYAFLLESGDIVVMGGESRYSYHGVPRIIPEIDEKVNDMSNLKNDLPDDFDHIVQFLRSSRININVRKVQKS